MDVIDCNFNKLRPTLEVKDDVYLNADTAGDAAQPEIEKKNCWEITFTDGSRKMFVEWKWKRTTRHEMIWRF